MVLVGSIRIIIARFISSRVSYDTQENRFLRWMLTAIKQKLRKLKVRLGQLERANDPVLLRNLDKHGRAIKALAQSRFSSRSGKDAPDVSESGVANGAWVSGCLTHLFNPNERVSDSRGSLPSFTEGLGATL